jgi:hypothetical protein
MLSNQGGCCFGIFKKKKANKNAIPIDLKGTWQVNTFNKFDEVFRQNQQ